MSHGAGDPKSCPAAWRSGGQGDHSVLPTREMADFGLRDHSIDNARVYWPMASWLQSGLA